MLRFLHLVFFLFTCCLSLAAQEDSVRQPDTPQRRAVQPRTPRPRPRVRLTQVSVTDTIPATDSAIAGFDSSVIVLPDSLIIRPVVVIPIRFDTAIYRGKHPFYQFKNPVRRRESIRVRTDGKEHLFYSVAGLLLFFALLRNAFARYLQDLFRLFFRSSLKQRQAKEQLMEAYLPSLLLNLLFIFSGALYLNLILKRFHLGLNFPFWLLFLYCAAGLAAVYLVKFITLKICGWIFRVGDATDTYTFIVFTTNKVIGIALLPFLILLAFSSGTVLQVGLTLSFLLIGGLFLYRYFLSYTSVQRQVKLSLFHFLLYLSAFEILPLLLINKLLFHFLG